MGIAASQARFLGLTARKSSLEYISTELAQNRMELSRQLSAISQDYNNGMNASKLMWVNDRVEGSEFNLSYSLLMEALPANDYTPHFVTNQAGALILSDEYATAAKLAGIPMNGGTPADRTEARKKFLYALCGTKEGENGKLEPALTENVAKLSKRLAVQLAGDVNGNGKQYDYNQSAGIGGKPLDKLGVYEMDLRAIKMSENIGQKKIDWDVLAKELALAVDGETKYTEQEIANAERQLKGTKKGSAAYEQLKQQIDAMKASKLTKDECENAYCLSTDSNITNNAISIVKDNELVSNYKKLKDMTIADILNDNIVITAETVASGASERYNLKRNTSAPDEIEKALRENVLGDGKTDEKSGKLEFSAYCQSLLKSLASVFGYNENGAVTNTGLNIDNESALALKYAYTTTSQMVLNTEQTVPFKELFFSGRTVAGNTAVQKAKDYNRICSNIAATDGDEEINIETYGLSLSNMLSSFLTYYQSYLDGARADALEVAPLVEESTLITDQSGFTFQVNDNPVQYDEITKIGDFYDQLFNNLLVHGWREDDSISQSEYMNNALKNGVYTLTTLSSDGNFYQSNYADTGYVVETTDDDAKTRAEATYNRKKAELTAKEEILDIKNKQIDAELAELNQEMTAVKNLLSGAIQKSFQIFSN